jgi:hypothetical protein
MNSGYLKTIIKITVVVVVFFAVQESSYGQQAKSLAFTAKYAAASDLPKSIEIEIENGKPEYKVYVIDKPLSQSGRIIAEAEKINSKKFKLLDISLSSFYICVEDQEKSIACKRNDNLFQ